MIKNEKSKTGTYLCLTRWVKYEEAVEEGGERWSKPHVSSLPMEALMELQSLLAYCPVLLDLEAYKMSGVAGNNNRNCN